ncbi:MAG TPA: hypothetical protein PKI11_13695 [Candidatus Hydrogenedentes bacterium]|nr:hypothetical protein [Candidatus Hydrogenedentota bacterium]HNT88159.1 hypothetical protein [Candidatus Hydrogenedentota bacterium]
MKHVVSVSRTPAAASSDLCTNPTSDLQVKLCFLSTVLTGFFVPVLEIKNSVQQDDNTDAA